MENQAANKNSSFHFLDLFGEVLFLIIISWICKFHKFFSKFWFFLPHHLHAFDSNINGHKKNQEFDSRSVQLSLREEQKEGTLSREEAIMIMEKLGIVCSQDRKEIQGVLSSNELYGLFEDQESSLEEVKEAFHVFDSNRDGFIDARKLQRVLNVLGFNEGSKLEDCEMMIKRFDDNGDGKIEFDEFVKIMENNF